jgi:hypothetical protein
VGNKSCRNQSFKPWGVSDWSRIDGAGTSGTANPDSYPSAPVAVAAPSLPVRPTYKVNKPEYADRPLHQYVDCDSEYRRQYEQQHNVDTSSAEYRRWYEQNHPGYSQGDSTTAFVPQQQAIVVEDFSRYVTEYWQQQEGQPLRDGASTYHAGMQRQALLVMQQESRGAYLRWSPRRVYEDVIDRMEAAYLVLVERHKQFLSYLHNAQNQQMHLAGRVLGVGVQQGLMSAQSVNAQLQGIESYIEQANAVRWESINQQTAAAQNQFDAALRRGAAHDGIVAALEQGEDIIANNGKQVSIIGQHWARDKYKAALAELALRDPQEYAEFWRTVRVVRLEIPSYWSGRYDGETLRNGVITCNPYVSRQRMLGNTVHNVAHSSDRQSQTYEQGEQYAEGRELASWQRQGKENMRVFA